MEQRGVHGMDAAARNALTLDISGSRRRLPTAVRSPTMNFDNFYHHEFPRMASLACTICGDYQQGEDLAQEAMARAHKHWHKVAEYDRPGAWVRRVTINLALSRSKRFKREVSALTSLVRQQPSNDRVGGQLTSPGVDVIMESRFDSEVWTAVQQLAPRQRAVIGLFYQDDLSTSAIAEILGCSVSTTTSHLNQARTRLAEILGEPHPDASTQASEQGSGTPS